MNVSVRLAVLLIAPTALALAADLGQDVAAFAPIAEHDYAPAPAEAAEADDGDAPAPMRMHRLPRWEQVHNLPPTDQCWALASAAVTGPQRLDGLRVAHRNEALIPDGQLAVGYHHDRITSGLISAGNWDRIYLRGGDDALSARRAGMVAIGAAVASTPWIAASGEAGYSRERGGMAMADLQIPILHAAFQRDQLSQTSRFGLEIRVPGSANTYAWSLSVDQANTHLTHVSAGGRAGAHGLLAVATLHWSPWNHVLFSGMAQYASSSIDTTNDDVPVATVAVGVGFGL